VGKIRGLAVCGFVLCGFVSGSLAWGDASTAEPPVHVVVVAVASDQLSLDVTTAASTACDLNMACRMHLVVSDNTVKDQLKQLHKGDHIQIVYSTETKTQADTKNSADATAPADSSSAAQPQKAADPKSDPKSADPKSVAPKKAVKKKSPDTVNSTVKSKDTKTSTDGKDSADVKIQYVLKAWCVDFVPVDPWSRVWVLLAAAAGCFALTLIFSGFKPTQLIISEDNRYSNSRFQMALWFYVLITTYIAALLLRVVWAGPNFLGGVNIPQNILLLSGMSAFTFAGAKAITANKTNTPGTSVQKPAAGAPNFFLDLTHNDGVPAAPAQPAVPARAAVGDEPAVAFVPPVPAQAAKPPQFDFGDFQMVIVTLIAVATYFILVFNFFGSVEYSKIVTLPDVDTTLLATFGLGQGAYLTKKAVGNLGTS
jgi:hypothetical protein